MKITFIHKIQIIVYTLLLILPTLSNAQWKSLGSGITNSPRDIFSISAVNELVIWAVATDYTTGISYDFTRSVDGGVTWISGSLPDTIGDYYPGSIFALDAQTAWVLMIKSPQQDRIKIFKTINGGITWQEQSGEFNKEGGAFAAMHFFNENEGLGFGSPGTDIPAIDSLQIYRTNNGGENWERIPASSLPVPMDREGVWVYGDNRYEAKGDTLWFGTRASRVFRTTDRGESWQAFGTGISGNSDSPGLASLAFQDSRNGIATTYLPSQAVRTTDGGETWTKIQIPAIPRAADIEFIPGTKASYIINEGWLTSSNTSRFLVTHDQGESWKQSSFTPAIPVIRFLSPTIGFAGGSVIGPDLGGIYKWMGSFTSTKEENKKSNELVEVFPNPVKDKLMISLSQEFSIRNNLSFTIYDILGQKVKQFLLHSTILNIDINDLTAGIYFYKLNDQSEVLSSGKMTKL
ncbi:MAG: T9SS type A sorting domain-containing protein [Saprospiraceae bacterium]|nr:T9SS type A sorting domain-containing protein [Saprospiraceae bacterium]